MPESVPALFEIFPDNWPVLELFLLSGTQWRQAGMAGVPSGLDYAGVRAAAALAGLEISPDRFDRLRIMEAAALVAWGELRHDRP